MGRLEIQDRRHLGMEGGKIFNLVHRDFFFWSGNKTVVIWNFPDVCFIH